MRILLLLTFFILSPVHATDNMFQVEAGYLMGPNYGNFDGIDSINQKEFSDNRFGQSFFTKGFSLGITWFPWKAGLVNEKPNSFFGRLTNKLGMSYTLFVQQQRIKFRKDEECTPYFDNRDCADLQISFWGKLENLVGLKYQTEFIELTQNLTLLWSVGGGYKFPTSIDMNTASQNLMRTNGYNLEYRANSGVYAVTGIGLNHDVGAFSLGVGINFLWLQNTFEFSSAGVVEIRDDWYIPITIHMSF